MDFDRKSAPRRGKSPNKGYLYNYRAESKHKLGDNEGADEDDRKAEKLKNIF